MSDRGGNLKLIFGQEVADEIEKRLDILSPREREVFLARRGFDRNGRSPSYDYINKYILHLYVTRERVRQIYSKATLKLMGLVGPTEQSTVENMVLQVPLFSCECGKWQGWRCRAIICDKCGTRVVRKGELQTTLAEPPAQRGYRV